MLNKELKEIAVIPFRTNAKKMSDVLALLNAFIADPKNPKVYVTLLTDTGFSINVEVTEKNVRHIELSIRKFRDFQRSRIGADVHKEEGVPEIRQELQEEIVQREKAKLILQIPVETKKEESPGFAQPFEGPSTMWRV